MKTAELQEVIAWIKSTDLVEVSYNSGAKGFSLATAEAAPANFPIPAPRFAPVGAPGVGVFQWNALGKPRPVEEGAAVAEGDLLGIVETSKGKTVAVKAPCGGKLARVMIEAGQAVEYGQALFFVEAV